MARKLEIGGSMMLGACALLMGCQSGAGSRLAGNNQNNNKNSALAKQGLPPPAPVGAANQGFRTNQGNAAAGFSTQTPNAFPTQPPVTTAGGMGMAPGLPPTGPQGLGNPMAPSPNTNVTFTQPNAPMIPLPPGPQTNFATPPGISPVTP